MVAGTLLKGMTAMVAINEASKQKCPHCPAVLIEPSTVPKAVVQDVKEADSLSNNIKEKFAGASKNITTANNGFKCNNCGKDITITETGKITA